MASLAKKRKKSDSGSENDVAQNESVADKPKSHPKKSTANSGSSTSDSNEEVFLVNF